MDWGIVIGVAMIVVWAIGTVLEWTGWVHGLLTAGLFIVIYRVARGNSSKRKVQDANSR
jgi:hypothetical protein